MTHAAPSLLGPWSSFYAMTGSSAAALTGLMFVVITLVAGIERARKREGISTFATPTVLHFCAVLFVSGVLAAPWHSLAAPAILTGLGGLYGVLHIVRVMYRSLRLTSYTPDVEDWAWYNIAPLVGYAAILGAPVALLKHPQTALFILAGGVLLLLFTGIHNAWDTVTFLILREDDEPSK